MKPKLYLRHYIYVGQATLPENPGSCSLAGAMADDDCAPW
jgi:hypothetical protein